MNTIPQNLTILDKTIRTINGLYSLNDLHKASGNKPSHKPSNFLRLDTTKDLTIEIEQENNSFSDVRSKAIAVKNGVGTFVCKELVYAYAMWISAKFSLVVIRAFDGLVNKQQPAIPDLSTTETRTPLRQAVSALVSAKHINYSEAFKMVHQRFGIEHLEELTDTQVTQAIEYVHRLTIEGELMPKAEPVKSTNESAGIALMIKGEKAHDLQRSRIDKLEDMLFDCISELKSIKRCNGVIHDGLSESQIYLGFHKNEYEPSRKKGREHFAKWKEQNNMN